MKIILLIFFLCTGIVSGQVTSESPLTQFLNTGEVEPFERTISILPSEIRITSTTKEGGKIIQVLLIKEIIDERNGEELPVKFYLCTSRDETTLYQVGVPVGKNVEQIVLTQLNLSTGEAHDLMFLIDSEEYSPIEEVGYF